MKKSSPRKNLTFINFIKESANTNNGEEIDALDASLVLQHAAKKIDLNEIDETE